MKQTLTFLEEQVMHATIHLDDLRVRLGRLYAVREVARKTGLFLRTPNLDARITALEEAIFLRKITPMTLPQLKEYKLRLQARLARLQKIRDVALMSGHYHHTPGLDQRIDNIKNELFQLHKVIQDLGQTQFQTYLVRQSQQTQKGSSSPSLRARPV